MQPLKVYVAGKYSATNTIDALTNIGNGLHACAEIFLLGFSPFCPWADASYILQMPEKQFLVNKLFDATAQWLMVSDVVYVISGKDSSAGVKKEILLAKELNIPVVYSLSELLLHREQLFFIENNYGNKDNEDSE